MSWQENGRFMLRTVESDHESTSAPFASTEYEHPVKLPPGFVATRLVALLQKSQRSLCFVAPSEGAAGRIAEAVGALFPEVRHVVLPPWDCLPYDRVPPSRHCMGRRMDALRIWRNDKNTPKLLLTSADAALQRVPPASVVDDSQLELVVGRRFNRDAFSEFIWRTGYVEQGVADDPGELAIRESVIDIYPAGAPGPMRIVLSDDEQVLELRGFDRVSQRTESFLERVVFGPASEAVLPKGVREEDTPKVEIMEHVLLRLYGQMPTLFDVLDDAAVYFAPGIAERVERHLEIIEDARETRVAFGEANDPSLHSLYLDRTEWHRRADTATGVLDLEQGDSLPLDMRAGDAREALVGFAQDSLKQGQKVVIAGRGKRFQALARRLKQATETTPHPVDDWIWVQDAEPAALLKLECDLEQGFVDAAQKITVLAASDTLSRTVNAGVLLGEPELRIGDVVVHEDHGVGILRDLENIVVEDVSREAARLEYRDGASILVPMGEFGKLWRYGSAPEAVPLDRLHTVAWQKKREKINNDIQSTARHFIKLAKQRQAADAEKFIPAQAKFSAFTRRFPYAETQDQMEAVRAVVSDLASGTAMNRLICGDVGFGKTEIALRAAAAVALAGAQVVVIAPTTVLARQHFATFERRFAGTGITVGMLSRLVKPAEAKQVKASLAQGKIGIVVATQAILAKDVRFHHLGLLIVDEEHRFGLKEKLAMSALAPALHTLAMSATPIPRTLQSALVGVQEVSLLTTPPRKRRPIRTTLAPFDRASLRTGLMREYRRGGQSFVVVPRIDDMHEVEAILREVVPELSLVVAHGKMPAAAIDEAIVGFAEGSGDVLLATNIIENGLDVPRANTMFVWHAERFGLAQLHQLRGRVGRAGAQGMATLFTAEEADLPEETLLRLSTLVENDRLGSGLAISLRDLDLRGGGDLTGEDQAGHIKTIGIGLYQKLLAGAVAKLRKQPSATKQRAVLNIGLSNTIPVDYVTDPAVRLNLYARLLQATASKELDDLDEELEDRFGEPPQDVSLLLRTTKLALTAGSMGIAKLEAGPKAFAITLAAKAPVKIASKLMKMTGVIRRDGRVVFERGSVAGEEPLHFFEQLVALSGRK
jgi:transcription-repair coupling factor (superfamily II helicase)